MLFDMNKCPYELYCYNKQIPTMGCAEGCRQCSCWCIFSMSAVMLLIMVSMAVNDMKMAYQQEGVIEQIVNTPVSLLNCMEVCDSWYTLESGSLCCDRYNLNLCVAKQFCKNKYIQQSEVDIQILQNDQFHEVGMAVVCVVILIIISVRKRKVEKNVGIDALDAEMIQLLKNMVLQCKNGKKQDGGSSTYLRDVSQFNKIKESTIQYSALQENRSYLTENNGISKSLCPTVIDYIKNHQCQLCSDCLRH